MGMSGRIRDPGVSIMVQSTLSQRWHGGQQAFHWLTVMMVFGQLSIGVWLTRTPFESPLRVPLFDFHTSLGLTILLVTAARLFWRLTHPRPPLPGDMPALQRGVARITHVLLYVMLFVMPVLGYFMVSAYGEGTPFWAWLVPASGPVDRAFGRTLLGWHIAGAITFAVLIVLHVGGALYHELIRRDNVLRRMTPLGLRPDRP